MSNMHLKTNNKKKKIMIIIMIFIVIIGLGIAIVKSEFFDIKTIEVKNNENITSDEVITLADINNKNILFIDNSLVVKKIKNNPYVDQVLISKELPSTLVLTIKEKKIAGIIKSDKGYINIDTDGKMVQNLDKFPEGNLPIIEGIKDTAYEAEKQLYKDEDDKRAALVQCLEIVDYKEYSGRIRAIDVADPQSIKLYTSSDIEIRIGNKDDFEYKLSFVLPILNNAKLKDKKGYIEVFSDGKAIFKEQSKEEKK